MVAVIRFVVSKPGESVIALYPPVPNEKAFLLPSIEESNPHGRWATQ
jgi:hypothetical protein